MGGRDVLQGKDWICGADAGTLVRIWSWPEKEKAESIWGLVGRQEDERGGEGDGEWEEVAGGLWLVGETKADSKTDATGL